jgi:hypothetical protein
MSASLFVDVMTLVFVWCLNFMAMHGLNTTPSEVWLALLQGLRLAEDGTFVSAMFWGG